MALPSSRFICFTAQKVVVFEDREEVLKEQRSKLESYVQDEPGQSVVLSGGCISAVGDLLGQGSGFAAAFQGTLDNHASLFKQLGAENRNFNLPGRVQDAELVCHLYKIYGRVLPQKMRGAFSFVLYDPAQGRVLAAASHTSKNPLLQARGPDGCLIVTTKQAAELPHGCHLLTAIPPGHAKYGWSSDPQPFVNPVTSPDLRSIRTRSSNSRATPPQAESETPKMVQRSSLSFADSEAASEDPGGEAGVEPPSPSIKKTRRGKRAGKNQKLRAELMARLNSDVGRSSLDLNRRSIEPASPALSMSSGSRADGRNWWRTDTPRSSFEVRVGSMPNGSGLMAGRHSFGFSRNSMSAAASPFVPAAMQTQRASQHQFQHAHSASASAAAADLLSRSGSRTEPPEGSVSRVILKTSMSGSLGTVSPFCAPEDGSHVGKADAAWHEGDTPMPADEPAPSKQAAPSSARSQLTSQLASNASNNSQARGPPAEVETRRSAVGKENVEATRLKSLDTQAPKLEGALAGQRQPQGPSAQTASKPPMSAVRNDSAHEALSSDSAKSLPTAKSGTVDALKHQRMDSGSSTDRSARTSARMEQSEDERYPSGASPPRGSSPSRPPKPPGLKFKQMLRAMIQRRPSHVDLAAEGQKEEGEQGKGGWSRSNSHGTLSDLDGNTGLWDAPGLQRPQKTTMSHTTSTTSLSSQKSAEKPKSIGSKGSQHGSSNNLAWLARQTRNIFSKSKSCEDLRAIGDSPRTPNVTAGGT